MEKRTRRGQMVFACAVGALLGVASCRSDRAAPAFEAADASVTATPAGAEVLTESPQARDRLEELRTRFVLSAMPLDIAAAAHATAAPTGPRPAIAQAVARGFELRGGYARAVIPPEATRGVPAAHRASVALPMRASDAVKLEDDASRVAVSFALRGAGDTSIATTRGIALYARALGGADVVHRVHAEGTEDFVVFESKPEHEEIAYDVDVSRVAGLRLVGNTLEFLDDGGTPRLRVAPPYVVDARGTRGDATLTVDGCAYDTNSVGPWGRAVTRPGAARCGVRVAWGGAAVAYPAMVDPAWTATGSMATARYQHTATLLLSGKVLVTGGSNAGALSSAELFDPTGAGTFAATGAMATARYSHTATLLVSGKVLVAAGRNASGLASAELFDGVGSFAATGSLATARFFHTATRLVSGKVIMVGGQSDNINYLSSAELFDPTGTGTFGVTGVMATTRSEHAATLLASGKVLVAGGFGGAAANLSSAEMFDPAGAGTFAATASMARARSLPTATLLASGKVLVAAGFGGAGELSGAELFDPTGAGTFAPTGALANGRYAHTATPLASGKVLVVGGDSAGGALPSAELFDPTGAGTFAATGALATGRRYHTATLLGSGKVLVAGGDNVLSIFSTAEIFALEAAGTVCALAGECLSGVCEDGICCAGACSGTCMTCTAGTGACVAVMSAVDPDTCTGTMTCDATGACKLKNGQPSITPATCASGFASDGVCCNTACGSACDVCTAALGASADGTCTAAPTGYAGNPACGNGLACDGASVTCPASCVGDLDCVVGDYCAANGMCQPRKAQAAACNTAVGADCKTAGCRACTSGFCVDGFCCGTACNTLCQACSAATKQSGTLDGTCGPAKDDTNPHNDTCPVDGPMSCAHDGKCDGAGACRLYYPPGTSCGASSCTGTIARGLLCNGSGQCGMSPGVDCDPFVCASGACTTSCATTADCAADAWCNASVCVKKRANGQPCATQDACTSGVCADGVCCNTACAGQCQACNAAGAAGTCSPVTGAPHMGHAACTGAGMACGGVCDGTRSDACTYPGSTTSCGSSCIVDKQTLSACDGNGKCVVGTATTCTGGFACDAAMSACATTCTDTVGCSSGYGCVNGQCTPKAGICDPDGHTVRDSANHPTDCAPFICAGGTCKGNCASVADCFAPNVCDSNAKCVAPPSAAPGSSGGCALARPRPDEAPYAWAAIALGALAIGAARRRRS